MPARALEELRVFHHFLGQKLNGGSIEWSPEEAVDEWRRLHPETQAAAEEVAAIQETLDDMANGDRGIPFDDVDREFCKRKLPKHML